MKEIGITLILLVLFLDGSVYAKKAQIEGQYCYQHGDSESLMAAKEISYAMALRKAIETYRAFISSTSIVKDGKLKRDLIEAIASGYVDNIKIIKQTVKGRTVCTTLIGHVSPQAVKSIIARKVEKQRVTKKKGFKGLVSNQDIKILNYKRYKTRKSGFCGAVGIEWVKIWYQAKRSFGRYSQRIMINCFDTNGNPIEGKSTSVPSEDYLLKGEVRSTGICLPLETASFEIRLP